MVRCILLCHDVLRINGELSGASQDELALMKMVEDRCACKLISRDSDTIKLEMQLNIETYQIKKVYDFTSDRKMMSITVLREKDGKIINYAKGADMVLQSKLAERDAEVERVFKEMDEFADMGLRTLVFAMKELDPDYLLNSENDNDSVESGY